MTSVAAARSGVTARIAEWIAGARLAHVPADVVEAARRAVLDHVACAIGGAALTPGRMLAETFTEFGGAPQATVWATLGGDAPLRLPLPSAVYLNSAFSNLLDFDDSYPGAGHPGGTVVAPALGLAEHLDRSGAEALLAVVVGYEVSLRVALATRPSPERYRQVAGYSSWQTLGAAAAAAPLLRLDAERTAHALGLGGFNAPVPNMRKLGLELEERPFSWTKNNYGWAAAGGVLGALLAERGFVGQRQLFERERGFWVMIGSDRCDVDRLTAGLGEEWLLRRVGFKPYACCRWTHTTLAAVEALRARHPDLARDLARIAGVEVATFFEAADHLAAAHPADIIDAQFSLPHVTALVLLGRSPANGLTEPDLTDPAVRDLAGRIRLREDAEATARFLRDRTMPSTVTVTFTDGQTLSATVDRLPGDWDNPLPTAALEAKFRRLTEPVIGSAAAEHLRTTILALESFPSLRPRFGRPADSLPNGEQGAASPSTGDQATNPPNPGSQEPSPAPSIAGRGAASPRLGAQRANSPSIGSQGAAPAQHPCRSPQHWGQGGLERTEW